MAHVVVTDQNFKEEVIDHKGVVLVDMWAPWCGPCQMLGPIIEQVAVDVADKAKVCKLNVDENPETAMEHQVMSIPTVILFKDGKVIDQFIGVQPKDVYVGAIEDNI